MQKHLVNMLCALLCAACLSVAQSAQAADYALSGFGTIGYAQSNQSYNYQRYIGKSGTFMRDSVLGAQVDASFNPEWSATVQAKFAPALDSDSSWQPVISWAFLSYRPDNDWLIRAGKLRLPFNLHSENSDVGTTYAAARLPLYAISPTFDFEGASFTKTWAIGDNEFDLDGYWGKSKVPWRIYFRDTAAPLWLPLEIKAKGLLLTLRQEENIFRVGYHSADITRNDGKNFYTNFTANVANPLSGISGTYYTPPGPSGQVPEITTPAFTLGAEAALGHGFRTMGEYVRRKVKGIDIGPDTESYYLSLLKEVERWTPYVTYARIVSKNLAIYQAVNGARVTSTGAPQSVIDGINAQQRAAADGMTMYDQFSWAIGTSYTLNRTSNIKAEWMRVHTGAMSSFVDAPAGGESGNQRINVYSLSYNFVF